MHVYPELMQTNSEEMCEVLFDGVREGSREFSNGKTKDTMEKSE